MIRTIITSTFLISTFSLCLSQTKPATLPACEWCGAMDAPPNVTSSITIPPKDELGQWITIKGKVFKPDGSTPASGIILYVYHTNAEGIYEKKGNETGNGRRHGYLRGWMKTDANGSYEFTTIRPASYPGSTQPQHIHITVKEPDKAEYWIDSFQFDDDPMLTKDRRAKLGNRGGSGIITLLNKNRGLVGNRDIILPP